MSASDVNPRSERTANAFTRGEELHVDVSAIERELSALWRVASSQEKNAVTRACSWNVIADVETERLEADREILDKVALRVPARLLVLAHPGAGSEEDRLDAYVSANCQLSPQGGKLLCSESITIESSGARVKHVASLVRALLVPDVPTAYVVIDDTDRLFTNPEIVACADRVVFDGAAIPVERGLAAVADLPVKTLADLAWLRLGFLRSAIASVFDPPIGAEPLSHLREVQITSSRRDAVEARLLVGWLASLLGWSDLENLGEGRATYRTRDGAFIHVQIRLPETPDVGLGESGIREVRLQAKRANRTDAEDSFSWADLGDGTFVVCAEGLCERKVLYADFANETMLVHALGMRGRDPQYRRALKLAPKG